jgi:ABC-type transport system substrate-binding protein
MFLSGRLESSGISRDNWDAVMLPTSALSAELAARGIRLTAAPALDTYYIGFNMDDPVVGTNRPLRQALACAFDADEWVRFYGQRVVRANGPLPPGIAGYEERATPFPYDPARTAALLAQAGYPGGRDAARGGRRLELTLELGSTDAETREAVELFTDFLARVGVRLSASYNNKPVFFGKIERRQAQMFWLNWMADYPDAENFLQLFYGPNGSPGPNRANYRNPEFDRLYEQARSMTDGAERAALCRAMAALVTEDCPWIFLHHPKSVSLQQAWLKNVKPHDFSYGMLKYYRIDLHEREQAAR